MGSKVGLLALFISISLSFASTLSPSATIYPRKISKGDTIGFVSPAYSFMADGQNWTKDAFVSYVESSYAALGLNVKWGAHAFDTWGYFAGFDNNRASDINTFFGDSSVQAIIACRGGWGDARIIDKLNYSLIKANPKPIVGYSDLTATINAIYYKTGLITFHGPMGIDNLTGANTQYLTQVLGGLQVDFVTNPRNITTIHGGKARGRLLGGNLSVLVAIIGSEYLAPAKALDSKYILFIEDVGEWSYSIDRMLTHLKLAGYLDNVAGVVWGTCTECGPQYPNDFSIAEILSQHFAPLKVPVFTGAMFGHIDQMFTLPVGVLVEIDADAGTISMLEPATK